MLQHEPIQPITAFLDAAATSSKAGLVVYSSVNGSSQPFTKLSYRELQAVARKHAYWLSGQEALQSSDVVLLHFTSQLDSIVWFWAVLLAGRVPCMSTPLVNSTTGREAHFAHLKRLLCDPLVLTSQSLHKSDFSGNHTLRVIAIDAPSTVEAPRAVGSAHNQPLAAHYAKVGINSHDTAKISTLTATVDVAALMLTSGSTGSAKAVCLTHKQIKAAVQGKLSGLPLPTDTALLNWIALDHVASLVEIHLCALFAGIDQVHVPPAMIVADPLLLLRLSTQHRVSRSFAPNFLLHKLNSALENASTGQLKDIDLKYLQYIASGGEANNVETCTSLTAFLVQLGVTRASPITPGFGMTETCAGGIFNKQCPAVDIAWGGDFAALGLCVPGIEMRIMPISNSADNQTQSIAEGALELRGPIVFERYFNDIAATNDAFTPDGWFKTGDLASIDHTGVLRLVGRAKELINVNGVKYLPHELENAIEQSQIPGVRESFVACFEYRQAHSSTEEIYVLYQHTYNTSDFDMRMKAQTAIIRTVVLFTGTRPRVLSLPAGRMQKTTLGKLSRAKLRISLQNGEFSKDEETNIEMLNRYCDTHKSQPGDQTEAIVMRVFQETLSLENLFMGTETPVLDVGVTSVDLIRLKGAYEKAFGIPSIPLTVIMTSPTILALSKTIKHLQRAQLDAAYDPVVTLQSKGTKTPLWLIHPGIGEVLVFVGLSQYFDDRPIYALRARGFNEGEEPFQGISDVLDTYATSVKRLQPRGPYAIAGYSYGSMLAFELAKRFEAEGKEIAFLGSFNLPPHIKERMRMLDWTAGLLHIAQFCEVISELQADALVDDLRGRPQPDQVNVLLEVGNSRRCTELALTPSSLLTWTRVAWALQEIGWEYDPSGAAPHMDVFYCQPLKIVARTREEYRNTKLNHWAEFVREDVRFHEVDGEHYTMIGPEHVPKFQATLKKAMAARGI